MNFERHKDPKISLGIGKRSLFFKLDEGSIIKLISKKDFDPTIPHKVGDCLAIHCIEQSPWIEEEDKDMLEIHYHVLDDQWKTIEGRSDSWLITPDFFVECFEVVRL